MRFSAKIVKITLIMVVLVSFFGGCAREESSKPIKETQLMLDTFCSITIYGDGNRETLAEAFDLCAGYEAVFSKTVEGSDVWRINNAGGAPVEVSPETAEIIKIALEYGELSGGLFDITIGQVSSLWDFSGKSELPSEHEIKNAIDSVDYRKASVEGNTVHLDDPHAQIDLGGIAKGYIADRLADFLRESGVGGAVIDLGGDIVVLGRKSDGSPWRVGVKRPFGDAGDYLGIVHTAEASIVSSGVYERGFEQDGTLYHHILDPFTGMPVSSDVIGATVVSDSSMVGDVLSTSIILMGSDAAATLFSEIPGFIGAIIVLEDGEVLQYGSIDFTN